MLIGWLGPAPGAGMAQLAREGGGGGGGGRRGEQLCSGVGGGCEWHCKRGSPTVSGAVCSVNMHTDTHTSAYTQAHTFTHSIQLADSLAPLPILAVPKGVCLHSVCVCVCVCLEAGCLFSSSIYFPNWMT